jgi:hypothetical protein
MSSKLLQNAGAALYGPRWQTDLARDLDISDRTIRRWASGTDDVPVGAYVDLARLVEERMAALEALSPKLKLAATP